jgi:pimeloyl-ACP methyl ester carboxylesterase
MMPGSEYRSVDANGIRFAFLEAGSGPLVLCLHGFPDTAHTFDDVLPRLAEAGYHAVAPWTRGIYPTEVPADGDYSPLQLGRDVLALIQAFGEERAFVLGQDWGAMSAYAAANLSPASINKMITVGIPHPRAIRMDPGLMWRGWHFGFLTLPGISEFAARWHDFALLQHFQRSWSPNMPVNARLLSFVKECYSKPGSLKAALGYYRSMPLTFAGIGKRKGDHAILFRRTLVPTLCFAGLDDGVFNEAAFDRTREAFTGPYELVKVPGSGHFLHLEIPKEFISKVIAFLRTP